MPMHPCGTKPMRCERSIYTSVDSKMYQAAERSNQVISGRAANTMMKSSIPRIITLGGDHTTTLAALRSTHDRWGSVSVIHFDSHIGQCTLSNACLHLHVRLRREIDRPTMIGIRLT